MSPKGSPCYNCHGHGHISADCQKAWRHFRCLNCTRAHVHADTCTSKWFDLRANFTHCEDAQDSREFNRLEFQRQQLTMTINQRREKRTSTAPSVNSRTIMEKRTGESVSADRPAPDPVSQKTETKSRSDGKPAIVTHQPAVVVVAQPTRSMVPRYQCHGRMLFRPQNVRVSSN